MKKHLFHFQIFIPSRVERTAQQLKTKVLDFGPHAKKRWRDKFGTINTPTLLPDDAYFIEIGVVLASKQVFVDTVLFRYNLGDGTDAVLSVAAATSFVISAWRVPSWFGVNKGAPAHPEKYLTAADLEDYRDFQR